MATERGVVDYLSIKHPHKNFYQLCPQKLTCEDMKMTTLEELLSALRGLNGEEIELDEDVRLKAKKSIDAMLSYGG